MREKIVDPAYSGFFLPFKCNKTASDPKVDCWAPEFVWGQNHFPPPEKNELVLSIGMGCADTVPFQPKPNTPF